ncbi:MAG: ribonuclease P protein component [Patescibacteria group bacterium]
MLERKRRLPIKEFNNRRKKKVLSEHFLFKIADNELPHNRFAVVIGKSSARLATQRHTLKRRIVGRLVKLPEKGKDILVLAQKSLQGIGPGNLKKELDQICNSFNL